MPAAVARFSTPADTAASAAAAAPSSQTSQRRSKANSTAEEEGPRRNPNASKSSSARRLLRNDSNSAVALFNDVVQRPDVASPHISAGAPVPRQSPATVLGEWEIAAKMKELSEKSVSPQEQLRLFRADIWPQLKELRGRMPKHLYLSTTQFLVRTCDTVADQGLTGTSLNLSKMCASIGKWDLDVRNQLVLSLCHTLTCHKHSSSERNAIVDELLDMWKHISQLRRKSQMHNRLNFVLPSADEIAKDMKSSSKNASASPVTADGAQMVSNMAPTTKALSSIFIQFRIEQARELIPGLLATLAVFSDPRLTRQASQAKAAPLLNLVALALSNQKADEGYINDVFGSKIRFPAAKLSELQSYVCLQWPQALDMLLKNDSPWRQGLFSSKKSSGPLSVISGLTPFHKQLRTAYRARNTGAIISIWQDLKARTAQTPDLARQMKGDPEFLDFWIFVWCAVRRPNQLQELLTLMQDLDVHLTVRSYTAMMHGWKMCKDADRIEALWDKLVESGLKLDAVIWTERISGLIEAGKPQAGIQALAEMQGAWKKAIAARGVDGAASMAVQPNTEVVNAAFMGLIRLDRRAANDVLAWAGREGIEPNIRTYNILLRESFRNDPGDVQILLKTMKQQNVEPDAATFTIILEEVLGTMDNASASEQVQAVQQVLADIEAAGLRPNLETYGKMLYAVASLANGGSDEAVAAVQNHMRAAGFSATPHMVTILIERALSRDTIPPDAGATIRSLLQEHKLTNVNQGDQTLWERVMSAHAVTGDIAAAMSVFEDLARAGRPVTSLPCLTDLLKALLEQGEAAAETQGQAGQEGLSNRAREVVRVVLTHKLKRAASEGSTLGRDGGRYWRHHFWHLARENGLIDWDEVPHELETRLKAH